MYWFSRFLCFLLLKVMCHLKARGKEHIPKEGGFILAANHVSFLDPLALGAVCPRKLNYMARHDLFSQPVLGWWLFRVGAFAVKRKSADFSALREAMRCVKKGRGLLLFPEGSRQSESLTANPEAGIGFLAAKLACPVIPVFVKGTEKALPKGARFLKSAKITVRFGQQILIERRMPYQDIAQLIMARIRHLSC